MDKTPQETETVEEAATETSGLNPKIIIAGAASIVAAAAYVWLRRKKSNVSEEENVFVAVEETPGTTEAA